MYCNEHMVSKKYYIWISEDFLIHFRESVLRAVCKGSSLLL